MKYDRAESMQVRWSNWVLCGLAGVYLYHTVVIPLPSLGPQVSDFSWYHQAGTAILRMTSPFTVENFDYPPLLSFLMAPLALLDYETARWVWFLISHICLTASGFLAWRLAGADRLALVVVASVWSLGGAIAENLMLGQVNPLLLLLLTLSLYLSRGSSRAAALGAAAALKIWPAAALGGFAATRQWKNLAIGSTCAALLISLPWAVIRTAFGPPAFPPASSYWMGTPALFNFSLPAVTLRALDPPEDAMRLPHNWEFGNNVQELRLPEQQRRVSVAVAAATLVAGLLLLLLRVRGPAGATQGPFTAAALISLALAASPICWSHYQLLQYAGAPLLLVHFFRQKRWTAAAALSLLFLGVYQIPIFGLGGYLGRHGWTAGNVPLLWLLTSLTPFCSLGLFCFFLSAASVAKSR